MTFPTHHKQGRSHLATPVLPLVRLVAMLFLATPEDDPCGLCAALTDPIDTGEVTYPDPAAALAPHLDILADLALLKNDTPLPVTIVDANGKPVDRLEAVDCWIAHRVLVRELEKINGQLCGPCRCDLCCTGPTGEHLFFEIPLRADEIVLFDALELIDNPASRSTTAYDEPSLTVTNRPFYDRDTPCLVHWRTGPSLVLPRDSRCPHLAGGRCAIYPKRPEVCRRPQIFSYLLEPDSTANPTTFTVRRTLLAVWDCPYVRQLKEEIAEYGRRCGLEVVFRANKA